MTLFFLHLTSLFIPGCSVHIKAPAGTAEESIEIANPAVSISGINDDNHFGPLDIVNLPNFKSIDLPSIESSDEYPLFNDWIKVDENALLNTTSLEGTAICATMPDFRNPLPFDGDGAPGATLQGVFPSIFGKSADGVVFLYDRHLTFNENSVENMVSYLKPCLLFV